MSKVLVLGDDLQIFLAVARSLGRRGLEVHAAPTNLNSPSLNSCFVKCVHRLPLYSAGPRAWEAALKTILEAHQIRLVIPTNDSTLLMLDGHAAALGRERLALPNRKAIGIFTNNSRTRSLAQDLGVPTCAGVQLRDVSNASTLARTLGLPLVIKPRTSYSLGALVTKQSAKVVRTVPELDAVLASAKRNLHNAEAFFEGEGVGVSVIAAAGQVLQAYQHRRIEHISETGASARRISEAVSPDLFRAVRKLSAATALDGPAMFEFRRNPATGDFVLLEVKPRFSYALPLAIAAGADYPAQYFDLKVNSCRSGQAKYRAGLRKFDLSGEFCRLRSQVQAAVTPSRKVVAIGALAGAAPLLLVPRLFDSWAADDRAPFAAERREVLAIVRSGMRKILPRRATRAQRRLLRG